jgi:hypothetical protein
VAFGLGEQRHPHHKRERAAEVVKRELPAQAAAGIALPGRNLAG